MLKRLALVLALLLLGGVIFLFWPESVRLDELLDSGQAYDVRILRDEWGVPHIFGRTDADVAHGLAYAHAEDDFATIQDTLLAARGQLASIYGKDAAPADYFVHLLRIWDVVNQSYDSSISPEVRAICEAYAAGLNLYAALHPGEAVPGVFPVTGRDIVAGSVHKAPLFFGLDRTLGELFEPERARPVSRPSQATGSNALAVSPLRSDNGQTFLAVNSHQPWEGPVTWYEAHLHSEEGWDAVGGLFPGMPMVTHGHNRDLGWAFTVNSPDLVDVYVLEINPDNPTQYLFDGEWRELEVRKARIKVRLLGRLRWTVSQEVLWSVYGPVVRRPHGTYAIRVAGYGDTGIYEQLLGMNKARTFAEWYGALRIEGLPMFNVTYADREGNIFYLYNGRLPIRSESYDWSQYLPGDTSETLWTEYLTLERLPQVLNPASGFIQNCNSTPFETTLGTENPSPLAFSPTLGIETHMTNRALRARELFEADASVTEAEFQAYKYDQSYSIRGDMPQYVKALLEAPLPESPHVAASLALIRDWDLRGSPDSTAMGLVIWTLQALDYPEPEAMEPQAVADAFSAAVETFVDHHGRTDVRWSDVNRLQRGPLDIGLGGGPDLLHAVYGSKLDDGRFRGRQGDSFVMLVTWDGNGQIHSRSIHQYGSATLDETSPHFADQAPLAARGELKTVWLDETDIRAHLEREYRPGEEMDEP